MRPQLRRRLFWATGIVGGWYAIVAFLLPDLECGPLPTLIAHARSAIRAYPLEVCRTGLRFGDINRSMVLQQLTKNPDVGVHYRCAYLQAGEAVPDALFFYSDQVSGYRDNFLHRVVFWEWERHNYPTFALRSTGDVFQCRTYSFDSRNPPTTAVLADLDDPTKWLFDRRYLPQPPCGEMDLRSRPTGD